MAQGRAGVGVGGAVVGLDAAELVVQLGPCGPPHDAVRSQAVAPLERPHRRRSAAAEDAVHRDGGDVALVLGQCAQPELHLLHLPAARTHLEGRAAGVPCAVGEGAVGRLPLAGQLGEVLDRDVDVADLVPCAAAHHAVGGEAELLLELFDRRGHPAAEDAVYRQKPEEGIILRDAVELAL